MLQLPSPAVIPAARESARAGTYASRYSRCGDTWVPGRPFGPPGMILEKFLSALLVGLALMLGAPAHAAECPRPVNLRFEITGKIVRSDVGFTQGLEWRDGKLYESTGAIGDHSELNTIAPDGKVTNLRDDRTRYFGEGLTILNDELFQLTWTEHDVFVYDLAGKLARSMKTPREGWGLTNDGNSLIFSDGGPSFYYADP